MAIETVPTQPVFVDEQKAINEVIITINPATASVLTDQVDGLKFTVGTDKKLDGTLILSK